MRHHLLRRSINLIFSLILAVMSVNLSGVLQIAAAHASDHGTYQPVWCKQTGNHWTVEQGESGGANSWALFMTNAIRSLGNDAVDTSVQNGSQVMENNHSNKIDSDYCDAQFTLAVPTPVVTGICGPNNDTVTVPSSSNYTSSFGGWTQNKGIVTIKTVSPYVFTGGSTTSTVPVTELNTVSCIINDATANVTITTPATCESTSIAIITSVAHATLNGTLNQTVGTHTATFTADTGHAFAGGHTTLDVTYTISPMLTGEQCAGPKPSDKTETRVITNDPVCSPNGGGTVTSWTEQRTHSYVISGNAWIDGPWSDWTKVAGSDTTRQATYAECPTHVTPTAPTYVDKCGTDGDKYTIPSTTGVDYYVNGHKKSHGTYQTDVDVTITAVSSDTSKYVLNSPTTWSFDLSQQNCPVTPDQVTFAENCGVDHDSYYIPPSDNFTYKVKFGAAWIPVSTGTHPGFGTVDIKAFADNGYEITGQPTWSYTFNSHACEATAAVTHIDPCGTEGDSYTIAPGSHVTYKTVTTTWQWVKPIWFLPPIFIPVTTYNTITPDTYPGTGSVTIKAFADDDYAIDGQDTWTYDFSDASCADISATDICGQGEFAGEVVNLKNDGGTDGYAWVNGTKYTVPANGTVPVDVQGFTGHVTVGLTVEDQQPLIDKDYDCTPGRGSTEPISVNVECTVEGVKVTLTNNGDGPGEVLVDGNDSGQSVIVPAGEVNTATVYLPFDENYSTHVTVANPNEQTIYEADIHCAAAPTDPTLSDACGTANDTYSVVPVTGVDYKVNGNVLVGAGPFSTNSASSVTITAEALPGYHILGANNSWTYNYTNTACAPGKGSLTGVNLPETGSNPLSQLVSVIAAGVLTYGATFFLVNRRDLANKK